MLTFREIVVLAPDLNLSHFLCVGRLIVVGDKPHDSAVVSMHDDVVAVMFSDTDVGEQCVQQKTLYIALGGSG